MLFKIILVLHILSGFTGLLLGTVVLIRKKGDRVHKKIGLIFTIAMVSTGLCAFYLSYVHPNLFLFIVGVFTIYLTISGYRMIQLKKAHLGQKPQIGDALLTIAMLICSIIFYYIGIRYVLAKQVFGIVFLLFGTASLRLCYTEYKAYTGKVTDTLYGLKNHIGRMTGAYIAAFTAFIVVNNTFLPDVLAWSLPGILGGIFISRSIKKLRSNAKNI
ncbi:DUF2306 domain-containing protein [Flavobacterium turcicum]|uniref:DUF2306 domain-containing protein n=1 Tax=Flavobacterium turcicum TaxID=2764718 RepID=A0ABR7JJ78_9FLAO|nr:DUF2306 domain-containing protein [Flavobacterium turcicum]MBC5864385.1 DUF2306 domain-containing protein [Flavobacterium turcicum]NHL03153.1 DUF2306 domain-containing protein [Flavobacterium turcicum]